MEIKETRKVVVSSSVHEAPAKVGRDTIEYAQYHVFNHEYQRVPVRNKTMKDKMEDFWDDVTTPFWKAKRKVKDAYWEIRYGFQRMFKGYDVVDTFETFAKFTERYKKILTEYKNGHMGVPYGMENEEWEAIIDEMLYHLKYMDEWTVIKELEKDVPEDWSASSKTVDEILEKHKNEFFKLFSKHFYSLWD